MRKFYIIFRDTTDSVEGEVSCSEEDFYKYFILPNKDNVYSYQIRKPVEELNIEELEGLIRQL